MTTLREAAEMPKKATPHKQLIDELLDSRIPKTEREHAAAREIERLRDALAQPEPSPVGYMPVYELSRLQNGHDGRLRSAKFGASALDGDVAVYVAPPQRKPLTDDEIRKLWDSHTIEVYGKIGINPVLFARYLEREYGIGEKNDL